MPSKEWGKGTDVLNAVQSLQKAAFSISAESFKMQFHTVNLTFIKSSAKAAHL